MMNVGMTLTPGKFNNASSGVDNGSRSLWFLLNFKTLVSAVRHRQYIVYRDTDKNLYRDMI